MNSDGWFDKCICDLQNHQLLTYVKNILNCLQIDQYSNNPNIYLHLNVIPNSDMI